MTFPLWSVGCMQWRVHPDSRGRDHVQVRMWDMQLPRGCLSSPANARLQAKSTVDTLLLGWCFLGSWEGFLEKGALKGRGMRRRGGEEATEAAQGTGQPQSPRLMGHSAACVWLWGMDASGQNAGGPRCAEEGDLWTRHGGANRAVEIGV